MWYIEVDLMLTIIYKFYLTLFSSKNLLECFNTCQDKNSSS